MNIVDWLKPNPRAESDFSFEVTDLEETNSVPSPTELAKLMSDAYWGTDYLANVAARYGYGVRDKIIRSRAGTLPSVRRGDFGEAVTVEYLKTVEGYHIPVMKLRYKIGANQTLPGTDCIAFRFSDGRLLKVAFVESKFRTARDPAVASKEQSNYSKIRIARILKSWPLWRQLRETGDPFAELIEDYIFDREAELDEFLLMILYERSIWDERILENLEDENLVGSTLISSSSRAEAATGFAEAGSHVPTRASSRLDEGVAPRTSKYSVPGECRRPTP